MGAEGLILCLRQRPQLLLGLTEGLVDKRLLRLEQLPAWSRSSCLAASASTSAESRCCSAAIFLS